MFEMFSCGCMSNSAVRAACLTAMVFFIYMCVADYLAYEPMSSVTQTVDTQMPLISFCVDNTTIDQATLDAFFDSFKSDEHRVTSSRHTKTVKYLDAPPSVLQCVAISATSDDGHVQLHFQAPSDFLNRVRFLFFMTDTPPVGNTPATASPALGPEGVQFRRHVVVRLRHPFTTDCKRSDQFACVDRCADDLATCLTKCRHRPCRQTTYVATKWSSISTRKSLDVRSSDVVTITYAPQFDLYTLLIYLAGLVSTFFGVSFWNGHRLLFWSARRVRCTISNSKAVLLGAKMLMQLVAIGCCVWQSVPITKDYFMYATQTEVYAGKLYAAIAIVPDISLCHMPITVVAARYFNTSFEKATRRNVSPILNSITVATSDGESQITAKQLQARRLVAQYIVTVPGLARFPCFMLHLAAAGAAHTLVHRGARQMVLLDFKQHNAVTHFSVSMQCPPDVVIDLSDSGTTSSMRQANQKSSESRTCFAGSRYRSRPPSTPLSISSTTNCCRRRLPRNVATTNARHAIFITGAACSIFPEQHPRQVSRVSGCMRNCMKSLTTTCTRPGNVNCWWCHLVSALSITQPAVRSRAVSIN